MKNKRCMMGMAVAVLMFFGAGCGGGSSSPTTADGANDGVVIADPTPTPTPAPGGEGGQDQGSGSEIQGNVAPDLDGDGIPNEQDPDADGDSFFASADDCNDLDASINPDAADKPEHPTYIDSNCDGMDGYADGAIWLASDGNDLNPGTIELPVRTLGRAVTLAAAGPEAPADVYIVGGDYNDAAFFQDGIGLYGGFGPLDANMRRGRDIGAHATKIKSTMMPFVIHAPAIGSQNSVIEGLEISGLPGGPPAITIYNSSPTIRYSTIYSPDSAFNSHAVDVYASMPWPPDAVVESKPRFFRNTITAGDCSQGMGVSVGVFAIAFGHNALVELTLEENTISSGLANMASAGVSVMADAQGKAYLTAQKNTIEGGKGGQQTAGIMLGRSFFADVPANAYITSADISKNRIYGGGSALASYGVIVDKSEELVKIANNFITGGHNVLVDAAGISLKKTVAEIKHNTINAGSSLTNATAILLLKKADSQIENNILMAEEGLRLYGIFEKDAASTPASLIANLFDESLSVKYSDFQLGDILNIAAINTIADIADDWGNIAGEAGLADIALRDYHLLDTSEAIDAGEESEVAYDIDGNSRSADGTPDIGADEFVVVE